MADFSTKSTILTHTPLPGPLILPILHPPSLSHQGSFAQLPACLSWLFLSISDW